MTLRIAVVSPLYSISTIPINYGGEGGKIESFKMGSSSRVVSFNGGNKEFSKPFMFRT